MAVVEVTIVPLGTGSTSLSAYVAEVHRVTQGHEEIQSLLTPMGTVLEGPLDRILDLVRQMHEIPFENGAQRVSTQIKIDDRRDVPGSIRQKLESVQARL